MKYFNYVRRVLIIALGSLSELFIIFKGAITFCARGGDKSSIWETALYIYTYIL